MSRIFARLFVFAAAFAVQAVGASPVGPVADHHQHLFSDALAPVFSTPDRSSAPLGADELVKLLDAAGIDRAVVLSAAYIYGSPSRSVDDEYSKVRAENDWIGTQAARYPARLRAFCGFNPLKDYALAELARCAADPKLRHGIKLHFGNSDVQLEEATHVERLRQVFRSANQRGMAIVVHMRASISKQRPYGAAQAKVFLEQLLPLAPDVPVQVAHLAGTGPGYDDPAAHEAMEVLAQAVERDDARTRRLWFDVTTVADRNISTEDANRLARRLRQVGLERVLYGSDAAVGDNLRPREGWAAFRRLPLSDEELARVASNVAPYLR